MINTGTVTFRVRSFGEYTLSSTGLVHNGSPDEFDNEELGAEIVPYANDLLQSAQLTVHGAMNKIPEIFMVHPTAILDVQWKDEKLVPEPEEDVLY